MITILKSYFYNYINTYAPGQFILYVAYMRAPQRAYVKMIIA